MFRKAALALLITVPVFAQRTEKPPLHGAHWMAVTGKPLAATAGAMIFQKGGNAVDAAAAMIAATCTMWDTLSWGGETQALIYNPHTHQVVGINALGVAPTGATPEFFHSHGYKYPPEYGPLAAVTPGTPGGVMMMIAEFGKLSLKDDLAPAIEMADGYPIEQQLVSTINSQKNRIQQWPYSRALFLTNLQAGQMFRQPDLAATLRKLVETEQDALAHGKSRKEAIYAAFDRFYKGDIAREIVRSVQEQGGLFTMDDLANWHPRLEAPVKTTYKGIDVYKLTAWTQGPAMLEALNILENFDLKPMGYDSAEYINTVYQAMSLAFADRDFYYGDSPDVPLQGLLSKDYAKERARLINPNQNDPAETAGDPYPFQGGQNPYLDLLKNWPATANKPGSTRPTAESVGSVVRSAAGEGLRQTRPPETDGYLETFYAGTTSVEAADAEGWAVSVTPSGGWVPAVIAGHSGVGLSERMQSWVLDRAEDPFDVLAPGKRPRVTLTPTLALKDNLPYLIFSVQGGDSQDQNLLQFFLDVVDFGMTPQQATEAANFNSFQMRSSFGNHEIQPGRILLNSATPPWVRGELRKMGYTEIFEDRTSGPINAIMVDRAHGTFWGGSSNHGEDYGIGW
ncbi:MAG TPA: gamma-glutamyltransferase [Thermoanaerobaculia bacterium]|nr:gamma-glutamyltransferase [Thermoanaerobaculia bacterium]